MKLDFVVAAVPPTLDGIGDYTANLAAELARNHSVRILTTHGQNAEAVPGVTISGTFESSDRRSVYGIATAVRDNPPDWVVLQYNPFCFGKWGLNPYLASAMRQIRRYNGVRVAIMTHEAFVRVNSWKNLVFTSWQRWQWLRLCQSADAIFCSVEDFAAMARRITDPNKVTVLPVGSNIARAAANRDAVRSSLSIASDVVVLGLFGNAHPSRSLDPVSAALTALENRGKISKILHIGPDSSGLSALVPPDRLIALGALPQEAVSRNLHAVDIYLAPFSDGVSTRRTTLMTGLQHGLAVVGTDGMNTADTLRRENGRSMLLAPAGDNPAFAEQVCKLSENPDFRGKLAAQGLELFESNFSWNCISAAMLQSLSRTG